MADPSPQHTPYGDGTKPFAIGLRPLHTSFLELDDKREFYLQEKARLLAQMPNEIFVEETDSLPAQREVLHKIENELALLQVPTTHNFTKNSSQTPLLQAAMVVQEDLIIMTKRENGWCLSAGCVCFPSSWRLLEKFTKPITEIHGPVPGFSTGTRNASLIERIFDNLRFELPAERFNWSVYTDDRLYHGTREAEHFPVSSNQPEAWLRVERQTLHKLATGDILFTVRIHLDPFSTLHGHPDAAELKQHFIQALEQMSFDEISYKGLEAGRETLIQQLRSLP